MSEYEEYAIEIRSLRDSYYTIDEISDITCLSKTKVNQLIKKYNIGRPADATNRTSKRKIRPITPEISEDDGLPLMEVIQKVLGDRMTEKKGQGYYLDGKPCSSSRIIEEYESLLS